MNDDVRAALIDVAGRLRAAGAPFCLGGGGLLWALGLVDEVGDLDLMLHADDAPRLRAAAGDDLVELTEEGTELFASAWFARLRVAGVDVDAIGGMALRHPGGVAALPLRSAGAVDVGGVAVRLADPALWWAVYRAYRPERAELLAAVVDADARAAVLAELGLPSDW